MSITRVTEYWVRELDEDGDTIEIHFCDTLKEAKKEASQFEFVDIEKCVRKYRHDGELLDEEFVEV